VRGIMMARNMVRNHEGEGSPPAEWKRPCSAGMFECRLPVLKASSDTKMAARACAQ